MASLYGPGNPKTLIPPIIAPPMADFDGWKHSSVAPNNYINNANPIFYAERSGYTGTNDFDRVNNINPYNVQALAGPNSWTINPPRAINSNLGISYVPQNAVGYPTYNYSLKAREAIMATPPYDPRAYGYGPSNRVRIDNITGTPYYDYKDIDSARQTDYYYRTNLNQVPSTTPETYIDRAMIQDQFIEDTNNQRYDLQTSLLRKRNAEMWQLKVAPISPLKF